MKELYRNFEGKLDVDTRQGIIVSLSDDGKDYHVEMLSVYHDSPDTTLIFPRRLPDPDWETFDYGEKYLDLLYKRVPGELVTRIKET